MIFTHGKIDIIISPHDNTSFQSALATIKIKEERDLQTIHIHLLPLDKIKPDQLQEILKNNFIIKISPI